MLAVAIGGFIFLFSLFELALGPGFDEFCWDGGMGGQGVGIRIHGQCISIPAALCQENCTNTLYQLHVLVP